MTGAEIGFLSIALLVLFIYAGVHIPVVMIGVSMLGIYLIKGNLDIAGALLAISATDSIEGYTFGVVPLFVLMGLLVMISNLGSDAFAVARQGLRNLPGGLGMTTVAANAIFAAITGVSIASASVFTRLAVPEMLKYGYDKRFAVGVVAGSSVLGMLIPPSLLFIVFGLVANVSVGDLFIGGALPGFVLAVAYITMIWVRARRNPAAFGRMTEDLGTRLRKGQMVSMSLPITLLVVVVLGGLYGGVFTATESGAVGALGALLIALAKRRLDLGRFWQLAMETGHVTASLLLLIVGASIYSRMLSFSGVPNVVSNWVIASDLGLFGLVLAYMAILLLLGTLMDSTSILLVVVPLFLPAFTALDVDLIWLGVLTVLVTEIGLLTPPFGLAVFVVRSNLEDETISLHDIFMGAIPFSVTMAIVAALIAIFPWLVL